MSGRRRSRRLALASRVAGVLSGAGDARAALSGREGGSFGILEILVETPAVSTREQPVRDRIRGLLPAWAHPEVDAKGNLLVTAGPAQADETLLFIAHMDETGYLVTGIRENGGLEVKPVGGFFETLYEGQVVLVHTAKGDIGGVVPPRPNYAEASASESPAAFGKEQVWVDVGASSRAVTESLGVAAGDPVTVPKSFRRLHGSFGTGRAVDDRAGSTAPLLALARIDPTSLRHKLVFGFSVEGEIRREGPQLPRRPLPPGVARSVVSCEPAAMAFER